MVMRASRSALRAARSAALREAYMALAARNDLPLSPHYSDPKQMYDMLAWTIPIEQLAAVRADVLVAHPVPGKPKP